MSNDMVFDSYLVTVSIPITREVIVLQNDSLSEAERFFSVMRDRSGVHAEKVEYDRARAFFKYTKTLNGKLINMYWKKGRLYSIIEFQDIETLRSFITEAEISVNGATMI